MYIDDTILYYFLNFENIRPKDEYSFISKKNSLRGHPWSSSPQNQQALLKLLHISSSILVENGDNCKNQIWSSILLDIFHLGQVSDNIFFTDKCKKLLTNWIV